MCNYVYIYKITHTHTHRITTFQGRIIQPESKQMYRDQICRKLKYLNVRG